VSSTSSDSSVPNTPDPSNYTTQSPTISGNPEPAETAARTAESTPVVSTIPQNQYYRIPRSAPLAQSLPTFRSLPQAPLRSIERPHKPTFKCSDCRISCNSRAAFVDHLRGRKHLNARLRRAGLPKCSICDRTFESDSHYQRHLRGKEHASVAAKANTDSNNEN
jgi:hypothetical protein